ncbi:hypothetical protein V1264_010250 [Littorina saxatilis]|uniref:Sodium-dependent multivitamin transporter n=1 Tax=Littorina saxatilis TaxID=31220 RepID=A0AAN9AP67_9CAEN
MVILNRSHKAIGQFSAGGAHTIAGNRRSQHHYIPLTMVDPSHVFHIADYAVFGVTILISISIGIYYAFAGDRQRTTAEYLVGGRAMKFLPVAISLMVSFESSIMMLGLPAEAYVYGIQWWISTVGFLVSQVASVFIVVPLLHPLKITSAYEYLQFRFNSRAVRLLGSFLGILTNIWYMGIVLFGPAIALEAVTGFSQWGSIFVVAFVAVVYTTIGGLKAVIWTDVFQAFVMYAGMFAILIKGTIDVGSPAKVWEIAREGGRLNFFNFDIDPRTRHTFWNLFVGTIIRGFGLAFNQSTIQRISSTKSEKEAKWVLLIMAPCFFLSLSMACYEGIVAFAYYQTKGCDPLASKKITNPNQVIPFTVMDIFQDLPGMPGLFLASLFSASLSTLSSSLSSLSALLWTDFLHHRLDGISEFKATMIAKSSVVVFGLLGCGVALLVSLIGGPLTQITGSLLAAFGGPLTGLFLMGCFCPWTNAKGALSGGILSLILTSWLSLGKSFAKNVKRAPWLPPASTDMCLANHSASLFQTTTPSGGYSSGFTDAMLNFTHHDYDMVYGFQFNGGDHYSTMSAAAMETTTHAAVDDGPQGIEAIYTMSYQWLSPVSILITIILGTAVSLATGGNKKGDVHPRYLLGFCDHLCCCLPECVRKVFRCADDYTTVKAEDVPPLHELYLDTEITITTPANGKPKDSTPMILATEVDGHVIGNDEKNGNIPAGPQNGGSYVSFSVSENGNEVGGSEEETKANNVAGVKQGEGQVLINAEEFH